MTTVELFGYVCAALIFCTFYVTTMMSLRILAVLSNISMLFYNIIIGLTPFIILQTALLPLNILRLYQLNATMKRARSAFFSHISINELLPFMTHVRCNRGEVLFHKDDTSLEMYYVVSGTIGLVEINKNIGPGELFGEISMFSPNQQRTATAVAITDVELLQMSHDRLLRLYVQNPRFAFYVMRLITRRLIENRAAQDTSTMNISDGKSPNTEPFLPEMRPPAIDHGDTDTGSSTKDRPRRIRRMAIAGAVLGLLAVGTWVTAPFLRVALTQDAVVTTWRNAATAPIDGIVLGNLPRPGDTIAVGRPAIQLTNNRADDQIPMRHATEVERLEAELAGHKTYLATVERLMRERTARVSQSAAAFQRVVELEAQGSRRTLARLGRRMELADRQVRRTRKLAQQGSGTQTRAERALIQVEALKQEHAKLESNRVIQQHRLTSAGKGVYLSTDGDDPGWTHDHFDHYQLEIARTRRAIARTSAQLTEARRLKRAADAYYSAISAARLALPPGAVVWSVPVAEKAAVARGDPILEWVDCSQTLLDVPIGPTEHALLRKGSPARVYISGETSYRNGTIHLLRGADAILGRADLASVSVRRSRQHGQALILVDLEDIPGCPVGRAASVEFPEIGTLDLVRSRLRL